MTTIAGPAPGHHPTTHPPKQPTEPQKSSVAGTIPVSLGFVSRVPIRPGGFRAVVVHSGRPLDGCSYHREGAQVSPKIAPPAHRGTSALYPPCSPKCFHIRQCISRDCAQGGGVQGSIRRGGGGGGGGGLKWGRGGGFGRTPPPPSVPLWSPPKAGRKILKLQSSWHRRRRSKILAVSLKHYKRRREGGRGVQGEGGRGGSGEVPPLLLRCTALLIHHWGGGWEGGGGVADWSSAVLHYARTAPGTFDSMSEMTK